MRPNVTGGRADLAGQALIAGLVDELQLFLMPAIVGGGKAALSCRCPAGTGTPGQTDVRKLRRLTSITAPSKREFRCNHQPRKARR